MIHIFGDKLSKVELELERAETLISSLIHSSADS